MAYLIDNPPASSQYRRPRRERPSGVVVVHTAENTPDFVAFDGGAEAVANFIRTRPDPGSYHDLADSDSTVNLVPYDAEAFQDGTGSNPHAYAVSAATRADVWPLAPQAWRDGCVANMAAAARTYADWLRGEHGIVIPARRITRAESDARIPGFISHAERDPARRKDPGAGFPWDQFLALYAGAEPPSEEDDMPPAPATVWADDQLYTFVRGPDDALWYSVYDPTSDTPVGWASLGGQLASGPAVAFSGSRIDVRVVGTDGAVWGRILEAGAWGGWFSYGGQAA